MSVLLYDKFAEFVKAALLVQTQEDPIRRRSHCNKLVWYPSLRLGCQALLARGRDVARDIGRRAGLCCRVGHDVLIRLGFGDSDRTINQCWGIAASSRESIAPVAAST